MPKEPTWKEAILDTLASSSRPLHYAEITEKIISNGIRVKLGATPAATVNAQISASIKHNGEKSPYIRVGKGTFTLKPSMPSRSAVPRDEVNESDGVEEQYEVVSSFAMFLRRGAVDWSSSEPKLLGKQQIDATEVDFHGQLGIYLLYDGREVIYVGRTTDRPLGRRLYEHTRDRLSARWDKFSWFGLLPVSEEGKLEHRPRKYDAAKLIPALEAILIEALEPRQNRKRGDDLAAVEYIQAIDPEIEKERVKDSLNALLKRPPVNK